jgi:hypothetical protein
VAVVPVDHQWPPDALSTLNAAFVVKYSVCPSSLAEMLVMALEKLLGLAVQQLVPLLTVVLPSCGAEAEHPHR